MTRYATARARSVREVEAYMPENYKARLIDTLPDGRVNVLIEGEDDAGWTLEGYVIPRLALGRIHARAHSSRTDAVEHASAAMN